MISSEISIIFIIPIKKTQVSFKKRFTKVKKFFQKRIDLFFNHSETRIALEMTQYFFSNNIADIDYLLTCKAGGFGAGLLLRNGRFKMEFVFGMVGELDDSSDLTGLRLLPSMLPLLTLPSYCVRQTSHKNNRKRHVSHKNKKRFKLAHNYSNYH